MTTLNRILINELSVGSSTDEEPFALCGLHASNHQETPPPATALRRTFQLKLHEAPPPTSNKAIETERRRLLHAHGVLH